MTIDNRNDQMTDTQTAHYMKLIHQLNSIRRVPQENTLPFNPIGQRLQATSVEDRCRVQEPFSVPNMRTDDDVIGLPGALTRIARYMHDKPYNSGVRAGTTGGATR